MKRGAVWALVTLCGCQQLNDAISPPPKTLSDEKHTLEITVPGTWGPDQINEQAVLQVSNRIKDEYVIVLSEPKEDLADMDLLKFSEVTRALQLKQMSNTSEEGPLPRTLNGMPAIEWVLNGTARNANVTMKHVAISGSKNYHQLLAWTVKSKWEQEKATLDSVISTLKETGAK